MQSGLCSRHTVLPVASRRAACIKPCAVISQSAASRKQIAGFANLDAVTVGPARRQRVIARADAASPGAADVPAKDSGTNQTLVLGGLFGAWYLFNIWFNIFNKQVLKVYPFPITCTAVQFCVGVVVALIYFCLPGSKRPAITSKVVASTLPLACVHTLGNLLTNMSLGQVAVSFTHTIKAMEPFFSVLLSALFLGDRPHPLVLLTLIPIVGGVCAASLSEATFNWTGFLAAMGSNVTFQSRNVLSKKVMSGETKSLDNIQLFSLITALSAMLCVPLAIAVEGFHFTPAGMAAMGVLNPQRIISLALQAGLMFHLYQQVSYMILQRVSPVTHSIGNCVKRVVVIVASVIFFRNPMSTQNMIGTAIALLGVFAYSQAKRATGKPKKAAAE